MKNGRIAVPSVDAGGMAGQRSGHFGHCDVFTLVDVQGGEIKAVTNVKNEGHEAGGCLAPVNMLTQHGVNAIVVGGIGMRPLMGFRHAGIDVYHDSTIPEIRAVVENLIAGKLAKIEDHQVCGGSGDCGGNGHGH